MYIAGSQKRQHGTRGGFFCAPAAAGKKIPGPAGAARPVWPAQLVRASGVRVMKDWFSAY